VILERIHAAELKHDDLRLLRNITALSDKGHQPLDILQDETAGTRQLFKIGQDGLLVTQILAHPAGRALHIWGVAGDSLIKQAGEIVTEVKTLAKLWDCRWVEFQTTSPVLAKVYEAAWDTKPVGRFYSVEVKDGVSEPLESPVEEALGVK